METYLFYIYLIHIGCHMQCFVASIIILFGKHYIILDIFDMSLPHHVFSPVGRRVMIIVIVAYYFEFMMPSNLI